MKEQKTNGGRVYRDPSTWKLRDSDYSKADGPSLTVQKQAFDIRELLRKSSRGLELVPSFSPVDLGDQDFDDIDFGAAARMDIHEQEQLLRTSRTKAQKAASAIKEQQQKNHDMIVEQKAADLIREREAAAGKAAAGKASEGKPTS